MIAAVSDGRFLNYKEAIEQVMGVVKQYLPQLSDHYEKK